MRVQGPRSAKKKRCALGELNTANAVRDRRTDLVRVDTEKLPVSLAIGETDARARGARATRHIGNGPEAAFLHHVTAAHISASRIAVSDGTHRGVVARTCVAALRKLKRGQVAAPRRAGGALEREDGFVAVTTHATQLHAAMPRVLVKRVHRIGLRGVASRDSDNVPTVLDEVRMRTNSVRKLSVAEAVCAITRAKQAWRALVVITVARVRGRRRKKAVEVAGLRKRPPAVVEKLVEEHHLTKHGH